MNYYDSFLKVNGKPKDEWYQASVELQGMQFDDTSTVWDDIEEETTFGSLEFQPIRARVTTIIDVKTGQRNGDNFRKIIFYDYTHRPVAGTRYRFDDNIWIVFATKDLKVTSSSVYVYRCNNTLNTQDKYGNIHREPCYMDYKLNETQTSQEDMMEVPNGRLNLICQVNQWTKDWDVGKRFILGKDVYKIRYRAKYERNKTFDENSVTVAQFYVNYDNKQVNDNFDLQIADYLDNKYDISCDDEIINIVGYFNKLVVQITENDTVIDEPLLFTTTDSSIVSIDDNGNYVLNAIGSAQIIVQMKNNPSCIKYVNVTVGEDVIDDITLVPDIRTIKLNCTVEYQVISNNDVEISIESDNPSYYYKYKKTDDKTFEIKNMKKSKYPVTVVCSDGNTEKKFDIILGGLL